ncbi:MAG: aldehyde dehydrogenase family protein, partial [Cypionkella sp.]
MLDTVTDLKSLLKDPSLLPNKAYIAGAWVDAAGGATFAVTNPARGDVIAHVPDLTRADAKRAIEAADVARREWAARTGKERAQIMRRWFDLCMNAQDDLAAILTAEMGKPL